MKKEIRRILLVFTLFIINLVLVPIIGRVAHSYVGYSLFTLFVILLPLLVITSKDALVAVKTDDTIHQGLKWSVLLIAAFPTLIIGLLSLGIGVTILIWIFYNYFIERQASFTSGMLFSSLGIAPLLVTFGIFYLRTIWQKKVLNPFVYDKDYRVFLENYQAFLQDNEGERFFCYTNRQQSETIIEQYILPTLDRSVHVIKLIGKTPKTDLHEDYIAHALYQIEHIGFPNVMVIQQGKMLDYSLYQPIYHAINTADFQALPNIVSMGFKRLTGG